MGQYRKKPVVIEAWQNTAGSLWPDWMSGCGEDIGHGPQGTILIHTLEGLMEAQVDDWIIKGIKGEIYPCKPDIFAATYEAV